MLFERESEPSYADFEMREQAQKPAHKDLRQKWAKASRQCAGSETREQAQKPAHKDLRQEWAKASRQCVGSERANRRRNLHIRTSSLNGQSPAILGLRPLMLRFLTAPVRALSHFL